MLLGATQSITEKAREVKFLWSVYSTQRMINGILHVKPVHYCQGTFAFFFGVEEMTPAGQKLPSSR